MRDPKRIPRILDQIRVIWEKNPDLRFCQLIGNCWGTEDPYYKEDADRTYIILLSLGLMIGILILYCLAGILK